MSFDERFLELMPRQVQLIPETPNDRYGQPTAGTPQTVRARVQMETAETVTVDGNELRVVATVFTPPPGHPLGPTAAPTTEWRITLPGNVTRPIIAAAVVDDDEGPHHVELRCG